MGVVFSAAVPTMSSKTLRRSSRRLEPSLSMKGISPRVSGKLQKTKSITSSVIRRSTSRPEELSRLSRAESNERTYKPQTFKSTNLRAPPHKEATDIKSDKFDSKYFTEHLFANKTVKEIEEEVKKLKEEREESGKRLKEQVFGNYARFLDSTTRLQQLENDMTSLRRLFTEQQQSLYSLSTACDSSSCSTQLVKRLQKEADSARGYEEQKQVKNKLNVYDELDCLIAERKFSVVVDMLENELQLNEKKKSNTYYLKQIHERVDIVSELLCREIQNPSLKKSECHRIVGYLIRLRQSTLARDTLLDTRWERISKIIKDMKVEGELVAFIAQLSKTVFSFLSETCKEYQQTFSDPKMMSGIDCCNFIQIICIYIFLIIY